MFHASERQNCSYIPGTKEIVYAQDRMRSNFRIWFRLNVRHLDHSAIPLEHDWLPGVLDGSFRKALGAWTEADTAHGVDGEENFGIGWWTNFGDGSDKTRPRYSHCPRKSLLKNKKMKLLKLKNNIFITEKWNW